MYVGLCSRPTTAVADRCKALLELGLVYSSIPPVTSPDQSHFCSYRPGSWVGKALQPNRRREHTPGPRPLVSSCPSQCTSCHLSFGADPGWVDERWRWAMGEMALDHRNGGNDPVPQSTSAHTKQADQNRYSWCKDGGGGSEEWTHESSQRKALILYVVPHLVQ